MADIPYDQFQDIVNASTGIFGGEALEAHMKVRAVPTPEGALLEFTCQGCNAGTQLTLEWPEVIALKYGVDPAIAYRGRPDIVEKPMSFSWKKDENAWRSNGKCQRCPFHYGIRIAPNEPEQWLAAGRRSNFIPQRAENPLSAYCRQVADQLRMQMGAPR
jgi:hypothetical protein